MKPHYTLNRFFLTLALIAGCIICRAQKPLESLAANNVQAGIGIGGNLFSNTQTATQTFAHMEAPKGSGIFSFFTAALWITATDGNDNLKCAAQRYCQDGHDFFDGPITGSYNAAYDTFFRRVFKITRLQVEHHATLPPNTMSIGDVDSAILFWPAKGNSHVATSYGVNIDNRLAPFIDVDGDGSYNPLKGDRPAICGNEAIFFVFNDARAAHGETGGAALGIEVRGLAEVFVDSSFGGFNAPPPAKRAINNTVFVRYEIENKSVNPLFNLNVGMFADIDLGCFANDYVGCDTTRELIFAYNAAPVDNDCNGLQGYKTLDVSTGIKRLNGSYSSFNYITNGGTYDNDPSTPEQYDNYLNALWLDGIPFTVGGNGRPGSIPTKYIYPGNPSNFNDWTEKGVQIPPGDRRMMGASQLGNMSTGNIKVLEYAFITSMDSSADNLTIVDTLKKDADEIQAFYDNNLLPCRQGFQLPTAITEMKQDKSLAFSVYPNPASSLLMVETSGMIELAEVRDMLGRMVLSQKANTGKLLVDVSLLAKGVYLLKIESAGKTAVKRIVVE